MLGLSYLHRHGIVHHDLKPHNILVNAAGHCVIADYGGVRFMSLQRKLTRRAGTYPIMTTPYAAPELLVHVDEDSVQTYDETVDYWSLGTTMVSMIMDYVSIASFPHSKLANQDASSIGVPSWHV